MFKSGTMTYTMPRVAGSSIPTVGRSKCPDYSHGEQLGIALPVNPKPSTAVLRPPDKNVIAHADCFSLSWYNPTFPGVGLHGVQEMRWRSSSSSNDAEQFVAEMRSSS